MSSPSLLDAVAFDDAGLVPVITQDALSGQVLMFAWMDRDALVETVASGRAVYYSRSRRKLWRKGEESGHVQRVRALRLDCDGDVLLLSVEQVGGIACHTGRAHCFYRELDADGEWRTVEPVLRSPEAIYGAGAGTGNGPHDVARAGSNYVADVPEGVRKLESDPRKAEPDPVAASRAGSKTGSGALSGLDPDEDVGTAAPTGRPA